MSEVPEEVVVTLDADDRATPKLTGVGRSFLMLGANIAYVTKELGIQSPVIDSVVNALQLVGHVIRIVTSLKTILAAVTSILSGSQAAETMTIYAATAGNFSYSVSATTATAANLGLAASFRILLASMGPMGWAMLAIGIAGAGVAGYALGRGAGGAAPAAPSPMVGGGPYIQINMGSVSMNTRRDIEETVNDLGTQLFVQMRTIRH
jgi:hypothetical protein